MTTNIDLLNGGDSHKVWDIHNLDNLPPDQWALQVIRELRNSDEDYQQASQRILSLPSATGMPADLRRRLQRFAAGLPPRSTGQTAPDGGQSGS